MKNTILRKIERIGQNGWETVRMIDLKKSDIFRMWEDDKLLEDVWKATTDGYMQEGIATVIGEPMKGNLPL